MSTAQKPKKEPDYDYVRFLKENFAAARLEAQSPAMINKCAMIIVHKKWQEADKTQYLKRRSRKITK